MSDMTLAKHPTFPGVNGPVLVVVMDGVGVGKHDEADAVWLARTPNLDWLASHGPTTTLRAHGTAVGLPSDGDMGNSEVGHNALGAGRAFDQGAKLVNEAIESGRMFEGEAWRAAIARVRDSGEPIHFIGLLSDGNVHSHIDHLVAMLRECDRSGVKQARLHALLDGRDVPETSGRKYVEQIEAVLGEISGKAGRDYRIASGGGRMKVTMDRYEADWAMVERGWQLHVRGEGRGFSSMSEAIETLRQEDPSIIDQYLPGFVIVEDDGAPVGPIRDGAAVIFFNFRGDRGIEISRAFEHDTFPYFDRSPRPDVFYAGMMQYDGDLLLPAQFLVDPPEIDRTLSEYLARAGRTQLAISETQKYGHVTYFWNGNRSGRFDESTETYVEIPSDTRPFEERPWMKAAPITDRLVDELRDHRYDHARVNYANGDMVGHTGDREAAVVAVEAVDLQLGRLRQVVAQLSGAMIVLADHGNADGMFERNKNTGEVALNPDGSTSAKTSHTLNPVPFHLFAPGTDLTIDEGVKTPGLSNVAATILHLMGYAAPKGYDPSILR
ncbi:MAG: 2,3-bisphosphoglycerate-independent phosphoglycerate mutase [Deltaproteobacteria bacterium]|nr:2,3-bisphosphoglycerate-independent phosphoglycerate mutase [Deltaproteobacteria bacterium]